LHNLGSATSFFYAAQSPAPGKEKIIEAAASAPTPRQASIFLMNLCLKEFFLKVKDKKKTSASQKLA
jgi:hypothetical protein